MILVAVDVVVSSGGSRVRVGGVGEGAGLAKEDEIR